jgi:hypothetical protein
MTAADAWAVADPTLCGVCGRESCEDHLPPDDGPPAAGATPLVVRRALDLLDEPTPRAIVDGLAASGRITAFVAESGAGKTFVLLDLIAAVSAGILWHGRQTVQGSALYLGFEGDALGLRLRALRDVAGQRLEHVYVVRCTEPLSPRVRDGEECSIGEIAVRRTVAALARDLAAAGRPPIALIVVDTVRASMTGSEDSSESVSAYLRAVRRIVSCQPDAALILAHHAGWQDGDAPRKRERGSSAWRGNCDVTVYLEAGDYDPATGEAELTLRTFKARDDERAAPIRMVRRRVDLCVTDNRGRPLTSCIIERDRRSREDREAELADAIARADREADLRILRLMAEHAITAQRDLRAYAGSGVRDVAASIARLLQAGWVERPARQRHPYTLTPAGRAALLEGA